MFECNVKKILARWVFKIFSEMKTFLVNRFTALTFLFRFCVKTKMKRRDSSTSKNDRKEYSPHRYIELGVENKRAIEKINLLNRVSRSLCFS